MQVSLAVQRHMEEREQRLNMPGGGLIIPCWHRRCRVRGRGLKKKKMPATSWSKKQQSGRNSQERTLLGYAHIL